MKKMKKESKKEGEGDYVPYERMYINPGSHSRAEQIRNRGDEFRVESSTARTHVMQY